MGPWLTMINATQPGRARLLPAGTSGKAPLIAEEAPLEGGGFWEAPMFQSPRQPCKVPLPVEGGLRPREAGTKVIEQPTPGRDPERRRGGGC